MNVIMNTNKWKNENQSIAIKTKHKVWSDVPPFAVIRISVMHYTIPNKNVFYTSSFQKYYLKMSVAIRIDQHEIN